MPTLIQVQVDSIDVDNLPPGKHSLRVWASDTTGREVESTALHSDLDRREAV